MSLDISNDVIIIKADICQATDRQRLLKSTLDHFGTVDCLVNNAGVLTRKKFLEMPESDFNNVINTNLIAPYWLTQDVAKAMIERHIHGNIINIGSIDAKMATGCMSHYEISKAGLTMFSKSLATELASYHIRANTILPGLTQTDINRNQWQDQPEVWQRRVKPIPLGRAGLPEEIAAAAAYLASDEASYTTGAEIIIDGGLTAYLPD